MAKKKRIWFPGAQYHVMTRGNRKNKIFFCNEDYVQYLVILRETKERFPFYLYAYCLMPNHVHLQVHTIDDSISKIMQRINRKYSLYLNEKYDLVGHAYQGRFLAILAMNEGYVRATNRYIHMNPVKAQMVRAADEYPWSSYSEFLEVKGNGYGIGGKGNGSRNMGYGLADCGRFLAWFQDFEEFRGYSEGGVMDDNDFSIEEEMWNGC